MTREGLLDDVETLLTLSRNAARIAAKWAGLSKYDEDLTNDAFYWIWLFVKTNDSRIDWNRTNAEIEHWLTNSAVFKLKHQLRRQGTYQKVLRKYGGSIDDKIRLS